MEDELEQEEQATGEEIKQPPKKGKKKPIMLIGIILAQLILAYVLWVAIIKPKFFPAQEGEQQEEVVKEEEPEVFEFGIIHTIEKITVNIPDPPRNRFLLTGWGIEVPDQGAANILTERDAQVRDIIIRRLRASDIEDLNDTGYQDSIIVDVKNEINKYLPEGQKIMRIYFTDFTIQ